MSTGRIILRLLALALACLAAAGYAYLRRRNNAQAGKLFRSLFSLYSAANIAFISFLWINHSPFPLNLEAMELTVLQHVRRVLSGLPIYARPSSDFVALVYNPLYYLLSAAFARSFGLSLPVLRLVSILGMLGAGFVLYLAVSESTHSKWWGFSAAGLFAAAYRVMDTYLDNAHADSWTLFTILLGCYLIGQNRSRLRNLTGLLLTIAAFWFKQYGAIFAIGAVLYLTWREIVRNGWVRGGRNSSLYWLAAIALGPGLYFWGGPRLFGPFFIFYTWQVPGQWLEFGWQHTIVRVVRFVAEFYGVLAVLSGAGAGLSIRRDAKGINIWYFTLPMAVLSAFYLALDPGNNNNVFIPLGAWLILNGMVELKDLLDRYPAGERWGAQVLALGVSFALLVYNPTGVIIPSRAYGDYQTLVSQMRALDGPVFAPYLGQLLDAGGDVFCPAVHWVPLVDLVRGPGKPFDPPSVRDLLTPVSHPQGKAAYILLPSPLEDDPALAFLADRYVLHEDLGDRYAALITLPKRFSGGYPRYLYRYVAPGS